MGIGFIGAGKVATAFGRHLYAHGVTISGYFDRHNKKTTYAGQTTQSQAWRSAAEAANGSEVLFITTRDDQISDVCQTLCRQNHIKPHHLVGHMSGAHSSQILSEAAQKGAAIFSLHPLQAFADQEKALSDLPHTYFSLEGDDTRLNTIEALMKKSGNECFRIEPSHKPLYHLAACVLSNHLVTLMAEGLSILEKSGIDPHKGFLAIRPLIEGTLANIAESSPADALTGPIARGDAGTIATHLAALDNHGLGELKQSYIFMGLKTLELATQAVLKDADKIAALHKLLLPRS